MPSSKLLDSQMCTNCFHNCVLFFFTMSLPKRCFSYHIFLAIWYNLWFCFFPQTKTCGTRHHRAPSSTAEVPRGLGGLVVVRGLHPRSARRQVSMPATRRTKTKKLFTDATKAGIKTWCCRCCCCCGCTNLSAARSVLRDLCQSCLKLMVDSSTKQQVFFDQTAVVAFLFEFTRLPLRCPLDHRISFYQVVLQALPRRGICEDAPGRQAPGGSQTDHRGQILWLWLGCDVLGM